MTKNELVQLALEKIEHPEVLINMVSRRVRQLGFGYRPLIAVRPNMNFMDVALQEIVDGKLSFEYLEDDEHEDLRKNKKLVTEEAEV